MKELEKVPSSFKEYMLQGDYQKSNFEFPVRFSEIPSEFMIRSEMPKKQNFDEIIKKAIATFHPHLSQGTYSPRSYKIRSKSRSKSRSMAKAALFTGCAQNKWAPKTKHNKRKKEKKEKGSWIKFKDTE